MPENLENWLRSSAANREHTTLASDPAVLLFACVRAPLNLGAGLPEKPARSPLLALFRKFGSDCDE
jgi:hypothetical protein